MSGAAARGAFPRFRPACASRGRGAGAWLVLLVWLGGAACRGADRAGEGQPAISAEFGILYGGQVQEREEIPFELDRRRKPESWRAVTDSRGRSARPRRVQLGRARWRPGEAVFEQVLPFAPGDPPGLWNIRILCGSRAVLDRPFWVYDPGRRSLLQAADAG